MHSQHFKAQKVTESIPDEATVIASPFQQTFGQSSLRFIDEDSKSKLFPASHSNLTLVQSTNAVNQQPLPNGDLSSKLNFSCESANKYAEFTFDSPSGKGERPRVKPKPTNLSLDTFEQVINDLNDPRPSKLSLGKKLFEKQQRSSEESERLVNESTSNEDTLNFDKEFSASMLTNQVNSDISWPC